MEEWSCPHKLVKAMKVTPVTRNAGRLGTGGIESIRLEERWGEMPGQREWGQQEAEKGGEERETRQTGWRQCKEGNWLPSASVSPLKLSPITRARPAASGGGSQPSHYPPCAFLENPRPFKEAHRAHAGSQGCGFQFPICHKCVLLF